MLNCGDYSKMYNTLINNKIRHIKYTLENTKADKAFTFSQFEKKKFNSKIEKITNLYRKYFKSTICAPHFYFIIERFIYYIFQEMLHKNHTFRIYQIGSFKIIKKQPFLKIEDNGELKGSIDIKKTQELKNKFISEGKETYHPINNPNGEKYFIYRTDDYLQIKFVPSKYFENKSVVYVKSQNSIATQLFREIEKNPLIKNKF